MMSFISLSDLPPELLAQIEIEQAAFLNMMVGCIVPATRQVDVEYFSAESGVYDYSLVAGEPFRRGD